MIRDISINDRVNGDRNAAVHVGASTWFAQLSRVSDMGSHALMDDSGVAEASMASKVLASSM